MESFGASFHHFIILPPSRNTYNEMEMRETKIKAQHRNPLNERPRVGVCKPAQHNRKKSPESAINPRLRHKLYSGQPPPFYFEDALGALFRALSFLTSWFTTKVDSN